MAKLSSVSAKAAPAPAPASDIDAIELLTDQHREVEALFAEIEALDDEADEQRQQLFDELALKISAHAEIEETIFYPAGKDADEDLTLESYEEHDLVKTLIAKARACGSDDATFKAKISVLKELIQHHVKEEEGTYFPEVKEKLGEERLAQLAGKMRTTFEELMIHPKPVKIPAKKAAATKRPMAKINHRKPAAKSPQRASASKRGSTKSKKPSGDVGAAKKKAK